MKSIDSSTSIKSIWSTSSKCTHCFINNVSVDGMRGMKWINMNKE